MNNKLNRYARHIKLDNIGASGQEKLLNSKVLVVGAGGLGSPILMYLASCGVGTIGIVDFDVVDETNLQRQIIHSEEFLDMAKVKSAQHTINNLNSNVVVNTYRTRLNESNIAQLFQEYDLIVDGCDNFTTRYLVNKYAVKLNKILVGGALNQFDGQVFTITKDSPCYSCIFPHQPSADSSESCERIGILGTTAGVVGLMQAMEVIKIILGIGENLIGKIQIIDTLNNTHKIFKTSKDKNCKVCS
jgi:adenylyltransferase/sulfurtransferase